jgi:hypothetical protein
MHFYGMQPSEYAALDPNQRHALYLHVERIRSRERLEFILDVSAIYLRRQAATQEYLKGLAETAYPFSTKTTKLAIILEAITR